MKSLNFRYLKISSIPIIFTLILLTPFAAFAQEGCRTGAEALGNAYVRANPLYAYFYGSFESYVTTNRGHFVSGGDSIRCAQDLSRALMNGALRTYDRNDYRRQQELNARMGAMGISPGPSQPSMSQQLYAMSLQLRRLARVLPPATSGNLRPFYTPTNEVEQQQILAGQLLVVLLQDPMMADVFNQNGPLFKEAANLEFNILIGMANQLVKY